jgi:hypothetical protein
MFTVQSRSFSICMTLASLFLFASGTCGAGALADLYKPKTLATGSPAVLYHADAEQIKKLFPIGTSREKIQAKYGAPPKDYGSTADKDVYGYSLIYQKFNKDKSMLTVSRTTGVYVAYDDKGKIKSLDVPAYPASYIFASNGVVTENRVPTEVEINQYLGPVNTAMADALIAQGFSEALSTPKSELTAKAWRLGIQYDPVFSWAGGIAGSTTNTVTGFEQGSIGQANGMLVGDEVLAINGQSMIKGATSLSTAISQAERTQPMIVLIKRGRKVQTIIIQPQS